jgi:hydroxymethylpyrimidine/phosphomethylpyrimidine kinase
MGKQHDRRSESAVTVPVVLTIAGSDSSAGAGVQADLKTFSALGVYGLTAVTCVVAEIPGKVSRIEPVSTELVANSVKRFPLVIDPVITATSGERLLEPSAIELYESKLFPLATLITPNVDEAAKLLGQKIQDRQSMEKAAHALARKYRVSILLKGGHLAGSSAIDLLFAGGKITEFAAPFVRRVATHGTGCTYSAAITASLASGLSLEKAIGRAKKFVTASIAQHFRWTSSSGNNLDALNHSI